MAAKPIKPKDIELYLNGKRNQWAPETLRARTYALKAMLPFLTGVPETLMAFLSTLTPRSISLYYLIAAGFWKEHTGKDTYGQYRKSNRNLFKTHYVPELLEVDFSTALGRINTITYEPARKRALQMLSSAQRANDTCVGDGENVVGKGSKMRPNFASNVTLIPYPTLYKHLKSVGLKPHTLRKLALTRLAANGATAADLCLVAGWTNISTAFAYLQPKRVNELKSLMALPGSQA